MLNTRSLQKTLTQLRNFSSFSSSLLPKLLSNTISSQSKAFIIPSLNSFKSSFSLAAYLKEGKLDEQAKVEIEPEFFVYSQYLHQPLQVNLSFRFLLSWQKK